MPPNGDIPGSSDPPALAIADLVVGYRGVPAVKGITLHVGRGEVVGLIGPNGAGKTSTLNAVVGAVKATSGTVHLGGVNLTGTTPEGAVHRGLALVPEGRHVFGRLSVADNLRLGLVGRRSRAGTTDDLARVLDLFPVLAEFRSRPAGVLSGGQQQQLAIARALVAAPDVLLLDEPSLGLSPTAVDTVFDALGTIREEGTSILVVEQRAEFTVAFADRTHVLHDGRIVLELDPGAAQDRELLERAYFGS